MSEKWRGHFPRTNALQIWLDKAKRIFTVLPKLSQCSIPCSSMQSHTLVGAHSEYMIWATENPITCQTVSLKSLFCDISVLYMAHVIFSNNNSQSNDLDQAKPMKYLLDRDLFCQYFQRLLTGLFVIHTKWKVLFLPKALLFDEKESLVQFGGKELVLMIPLFPYKVIVLIKSELQRTEISALHGDKPSADWRIRAPKSGIDWLHSYRTS